VFNIPRRLRNRPDDSLNLHDATFVPRDNALSQLVAFMTDGVRLWNTDLDVAMPAELRRFSTVVLSRARHLLLFADPAEARFSCADPGFDQALRHGWFHGWEA